MAAFTFTGCQSNKPKYETVLMEVLETMSIGNADEDWDTTNKSRKTMEKIFNAFTYQMDFENVPQIENLLEYFMVVDESLQFRNADSTQTVVIDSRTLYPALRELERYANGERSDYPAELVLNEINVLQEQFSLAQEMEWQELMAATIYLNRFTQQALKLCPDIHLLTDEVSPWGDAGIIKMQCNETSPVTNILAVKGNDGKFQTMFNDCFSVNKINAYWREEGIYWLAYCDNPDNFKAYVLFHDKKTDDFHWVLQSTSDESIPAIKKWMGGEQFPSGTKIYACGNGIITAVLDCGDYQETRNLNFIRDSELHKFLFTFNPDTDIIRELKSNLREKDALLRKEVKTILDSLKNPLSPFWDILFSSRSKAETEVLEHQYLVSFNQDNSLMAIGTEEEDVVVVDNETRTIHPFTIKGDGSTLISIQFSPDSQRLLVQSWSGRIQVTDIQSGNELCCYQPDRREIDTPIAYDWDSNSGYIGDYVNLIKFYPYEKKYDIVDKMHSAILCITPNNFGTLDIATEDEIHIRYDAEKKSAFRSISVPKKYCPEYLDESSDGRTILSVGFDGKMIIYEVETGKEIATYDKVISHGSRACFSDGDTSVVYVNAENGSVCELPISIKNNNKS